MSHSSPSGPPTAFAIVDGHPVDYKAALWRRLAQRPGVEETVLFLDRQGLETYYDPGFMARREGGDEELLLRGFRSRFLRNWSRDPSRGFFSRINPSLVPELWRGRYDVVLVAGYVTLSVWIAFLAAKLARKKVVWRGEGTLAEAERGYAPRFLLKRLALGILLRGSDAVLYSCVGNRAYLEHYGAAREKLFFLPCAVDNAFFQAQAAAARDGRDELRKELGFGNEDLVVVFLARFTERKRPLDLIRAAAATGRGDLCLLFVGDGPLRGEMEEEVSRLGVRAAFTGFLDRQEAARYLAAADAYVNIAEKDPSPKVLNEAMNFGLPVICSDALGTAADLVLDGENGFVVPLGAIDDLSDRLRHLCENRSHAAEMGESSLSIVEGWSLEEGAEGLHAAARFALTGSRERQVGE